MGSWVVADEPSRRRRALKACHPMRTPGLQSGAWYGLPGVSRTSKRAASCRQHWIASATGRLKPGWQTAARVPRQGAGVRRITAWRVHIADWPRSGPPPPHPAPQWRLQGSTRAAAWALGHGRNAPRRGAGQPCPAGTTQLLRWPNTIQIRRADRRQVVGRIPQPPRAVAGAAEGRQARPGANQAVTAVDTHPLRRTARRRLTSCIEGQGAADPLCRRPLST